MRTWSFAKGHGTLNDFVILQDRHALLSPSPDDVRFLCDRRRGVGGDGLLRVTKAEHFPEWEGEPSLWFMDYRNADGSIAELCGNGARVFVRYLLEQNLASGDRIAIATRAGLVSASVERDGRITVTLGRPRREDDSTTIHASGRDWTAHHIDVGNPHAVVWLASESELGTLDLHHPPTFPPDRYPDGGNAEFVWSLDTGHIQLRVWERGVGETPSCGTGVVAAAFDHLSVAGRSTGAVRVTTPGGTLDVRIDADGLAHLAGPAIIVAHGAVNLPSD
ncbi:MAG: diaminopimelate epimerase [Propionibacteriaceae bacterium]|jgi:diaminopimelate epimerase|nr:diaminopimelate epimerase [Propionibacteriaceae bacterium]